MFVLATWRSQIGDVVTKLRDAEEELMLVVSEEEAIGEVVSDLRGVIEVLQQIRLELFRSNTCPWLKVPPPEPLPRIFDLPPKKWTGLSSF